MSEKLAGWRHVWLYAKGHYRRSEEILTDLRIIIGRGAACKPQHVSDKDVLTVVYETASPYLDRRVGTGRSILRVLTNLFYLAQHTPLTVEDIVSELLSILSITRVRDADGKEVIKLGEPDYTLLPKPE